MVSFVKRVVKSFVNKKEEEKELGGSATFMKQEQVKDLIAEIENQIKNGVKDQELASGIENIMDAKPIALIQTLIDDDLTNRKWIEVKVVLLDEQIQVFQKREFGIWSCSKELEAFFEQKTGERYNFLFENYDIIKFNYFYKNDDVYTKIKRIFDHKYQKYGAYFIEYPAQKYLIVQTEKEKSVLLSHVDLLTLSREYYEVIQPYDPKGIFKVYKAGDIVVCSEEEIVKKHGSMANFYGVNLY